MPNRKAIPRQTMPMSNEEKELFSSALKNYELELPSSDPVQVSDLPLRQFLDRKYLEWAGYFLNALKEDAFRGSLNALRQLRQYNVQIGFTVRGVFDHVWMGHNMDSRLEEAVTAYKSRKRSWKRLKTILDKAAELTDISASEPVVTGFDGKGEDPFARNKEALFCSINDALSALNEIYTYELGNYDPDPLRKAYQRVLANQMNFILPPETFFKDQKWWDELANLMADAKMVLVTRMKDAVNRGRGYSAQSLRDISRDYTPDDAESLRRRFRSSMPDFFERIETEPANQVLDSLRQAACFSPSLKSRRTIELAMAVLEGRIKRTDEV